MKDRTYLIIIVVLLGYIVFIQQCATPDVIEVPGEPVVTTDTLYLPSDTVIVEGPTQYVNIPIPVPYDSSGGVRSYRQPYADAWISGTFYAQVKGTLLDWNLEYTPFQRVINETVYVVRNTVTPIRIQPLPGQRGGTNLLLGAGLSGNIDQQSIQINAGIDRGKYIYLADYDPMLKKYGFTIIRKFSF